MLRLPLIVRTLRDSGLSAGARRSRHAGDVEVGVRHGRIVVTGAPGCVHYLDRRLDGAADRERVSRYRGGAGMCLDQVKVEDSADIGLVKSVSHYTEWVRRRVAGFADARSFADARRSLRPGLVLECQRTRLRKLLREARKAVLYTRGRLAVHQMI